MFWIVTWLSSARRLPPCVLLPVLPAGGGGACMGMGVMVGCGTPGGVVLEPLYKLGRHSCHRQHQSQLCHAIAVRLCSSHFATSEGILCTCSIS